MKRILSLLGTPLLVLSLLLVPVEAKEKVLLDTDMVEAFDDGVAMLMLAHDPRIDLLGVTTVSGNSWVEQGTAYGLRQLEVDRLDDIPLAMGMERPFRADRHENYALERELWGQGYDLWIGSFGLEKPASWQSFYRERYGASPRLKPVQKHAVNFIIDTVRQNPHEVTIAAIGPCTNLAAAIRMAPDIVPLVKRVVYMGGAFYTHGNATPAAEFNWYFDPESARMMLRAPFKEQIILPLDVCEKIVFTKARYDRLLVSMGDSPQKDILRSTFVGQSFESDPNFTHFVWDVLVSAVIIDPTLITGEITQHVDINDAQGLSYGQSLAYPRVPPQGAKKARIVLSMDGECFWNMLNEKTYWPNAK